VKTLNLSPLNLINLFMKATAFILCLAISCATLSQAQDEARAVWQVTGFDIAVNNPGADRSLRAKASVSVRNVGRASGSTLTLRINSKAEIKTATIAGGTARFRSLPEPRGNAQRITVTLPGSVGPNESTTVSVEYSLPVAENSGLAALSPIGSQFLPSSLWYPTPNTAFAAHGADYAPFRLTVSGVTAISSGLEKSAGGNSVFDQPLNAQPFFVSGNWDRIDGSGNSAGISAFIAKGADNDKRTQATNLIALTASARAFYASLFGAAPDVPLRLVEVARGGGFDDGGVMLLGAGTFGRKKIDTATALNVAEGVARLWIGGATPIRGEAPGVLREGLVRFFAVLFIEKQFGADAAEDERARERLAHAAVVRREAPLSLSTPSDPGYFSSVPNKGAMVWRLVDRVIGHDPFISGVRELLTSGKSDPEGLSLTRARAVFVAKGPSTLKALLDQEFDQPTDMDLMIGVPHLENGQWVAALRNLGSNEVNVNVRGFTNSGQTIDVRATIPAHDFGQAAFKTTTPIVRVEVDPEKIYPQIDYGNDLAPHAVDPAAVLSEATRLFGAQDYAKSETAARQLLTAAPRMNEARIMLARSLLAENKVDEAEREFKRLADERLPTPPMLAWASVGLGEIALRRGQNAEAVRYFSDAVRADAEYPSSLAAREARLRAEGASAHVDESAKAFINQLDQAIRSGRQTEIENFIVPGELQRFVHGVIGTQPELWQTQVRRTEELNANQVAADVQLNTKQLGTEHSGTAVFMLAKVGSAWKLNAIEFFEVK